MNQNQIKVIQSRLKNRGKKFTLEYLRTYVLVDYRDEELTEDQISAIVDKLSGSDALELANTALSGTDSSASELSQTQRQTLIQQVASTIDVSLPVEQIKLISQKMDWAISDRASLKTQIQSAIVAWINHQIDQDKQQTDEMMQEVEQHFVTKLQEGNDHFDDKTRAFSIHVGQARDKFRATEAEILDFFKISG
ncbi:MAG TPA: hypothetical protein VE944_28905 [Nostoc sp.]|uniref:hypothetical protein n=1 Tax=Nostoc sp. TaxID=1180 RepID=UPI002D431000|nr:hypothetical protein [Nostoc sp.]HYX18314.1 hypothetical protein [Nostoc sp.]